MAGNGWPGVWIEKDSGMSGKTLFPWVEDIPRAQQLFQEQLQVNWTERSNRSPSG